MIYHDEGLTEPLPGRGSVFGAEAVVLTIGAGVGITVERSVPTWAAGVGVLVLAAWAYPRARRLVALRSARWWRAAVLAALVAGVLFELIAPGRAPELVRAAGPLVVGEAGAVFATDVPWSRRWSAWRPVFRLSMRLFGLIAAAAALTQGTYVGMASGSAAALAVGLGILPLLMPRPDRILVEGESRPAERRRCTRCGVPSDWPTEGQGICGACGLIRRDLGKAPSTAD